MIMNIKYVGIFSLMTPDDLILFISTVSMIGEKIYSHAHREISLFFFLKFTMAKLPPLMFLSHFPLGASISKCRVGVYMLCSYSTTLVCIKTCQLPSVLDALQTPRLLPSAFFRRHDFCRLIITVNHCCLPTVFFYTRRPLCALARCRPRCSQPD